MSLIKQILAAEKSKSFLRGTTRVLRLDGLILAKKADTITNAKNEFGFGRFLFKEGISVPEMYDYVKIIFTQSSISAMALF